MPDADRESSVHVAGAAACSANRLIHETSPYLLQHAHNPVQWYPWGPEAFQRARQDDKPVFLSVGYSTCYWCHVMERESFENESVAAILNEHYIAIKVDREERPDIDEQYMLAGEVMTGRGGWPNSVWLTPDGRPWMAGTYFPRDQFKHVLRNLSDIWRTRRKDVEEQADQLALAVREVCSGKSIPKEGRTVNRSLIDRAIAEMRASFDAARGGFGDAPKFPPHDRLTLLAHEYRRTRDKSLLEMLTSTLDAMARGGIHDHLGGGFHRYSTDAEWLVPHFEKMLYDNAQLLRAFVDGHLLTGDETFREAAQDIVAWLQREMTDPGGAFYSAIDAESEREEGKFYVWRYDEIVQALSEPHAKLFAESYGLEPGGNYLEHPSGHRPGTNILHLPRRLAQFAGRRGLNLARLTTDLEAMRSSLLEIRNRRVRPHLDDKILASWNGLMIGSLAYAGRFLHEPRYTHAAVRAAEFILGSMMRDGRLSRSYRAGQARLPGYLDDHAFLADGLVSLYEATDDRRWLDDAVRLADIMCDDFLDKAGGGFFFTAANHEDLLVRSKSLIGGGNIPSANAVAAQLLLRLSAILGRDDYRRKADAALAALADLMWRQPHGTESLVLAAAMSLDAARGQPDESASDGHHAGEHVTVDVFASHRALKPGQTFHVAVVLGIKTGWHLYGANSDTKAITPVSVSIKPHGAVKTATPVAPQGRRTFDAALGATIETYEGRITFLLPADVAADTEAGAMSIAVEVRTQACDHARCLPPEMVILRLPLEVRADAVAEPRHGELFQSLGVRA